MENHVIHPDEAWNVYFYMRKEQLESIQNMMQLLSQVYRQLPHGDMVAELFDQLSGDVLAEEYTGRTERLLEELQQEFQEMELPDSRENSRSAPRFCNYAVSLRCILRLPNAIKARWSCVRRRTSSLRRAKRKQIHVI